MGLLIPWYIRAGAVLLLAASCGIAGLVFGMRWEQGQQAIAEAKLTEANKVIVKTDVVERTKIEKVYVEKRAARAREMEASNAETARHARTLADPVGCWLDPDRVRGINNAWGVGTPAATGGGPGGVRPAVGAGERQSPGSGKLGEGSGVQVPRVLGSSAGAGGEGSSTSKAGGDQ